MQRVCITFDVEHDCPPFRTTYRGIEEGLPKLLALLAKKGIKATFFTTGDVATKYPQLISELVQAGHELGSHGLSHVRFDKITKAEAQKEITGSTAILRNFYPVRSFRAPNLQFPTEYLPYLTAAGYTLDSTLARHKNPRHTIAKTGSLLRVPVTTTSIVLRLPRWLRTLFLARFHDPVVIFFHPWEFVDLRREKLRLDCTYHTGSYCLEALGQIIDFYRARGREFLTMQELGATF